ncbi:MAG TPA: autotransporter domain-containing protein, partial [Roseococcus sp.]|nr:autotransporter domain-containing protein [Roseococcus sp.]
LDLNQSGDSTFAGVIEGSGAFHRQGKGELVLTGLNTYTGLTTVEAGHLRTSGGAGRLAGGGAFTVNDGARLTFGTSEVIGALANSGATTLDAGQTLTVASLVNTGTGAMTLNGVLTSLGAVQNQAGGTIALDADLNATGQTVTQDGTITVTGQRTLTLGQFTGGGGVTLSDGARLTIAQSGNSTFAGVMQGPGDFTRVGSGTLTLTAAQGFTGLATVQAGATLALSGAGAIATASSLALGGIFDISATSGGASLRALTGTGQVALGSDAGNPRSLRLTAAEGSFGGQITGTGGLFVDAGAAIFTGASTYTGPTTIATGASLALGGMGGIAGSAQVLVDGLFTVQDSSPGVNLQALSVRSGGVAQAQAPVQVAGTLQVSAGTLNGPATFTAPRYELTNAAVNAPLGGGFLQVAGNTFLTAPAAAGTVVVLENATLGLMGAQLLSDQAGVEVRTTGRLALLGGDQTIRDLSGAGNIVLNGFELRVTGNSVFTGAFEGAGDVLVTAGQLQIGSDTQQTLLTVGQSGQLDVTGSVTSTDMTMVQGDMTIAPGGQVNTPNFTLAPGGSTQVGGTLQSGLTQVLGTMTLTGGTVQNTQMMISGLGGSLGGSGGVTGNTIVMGGGTLSAGFSVGALNFDNLTIGAGGRVELEIEGAAGAGALDGHDVYRASGDIAIDRAAVLDIRRYTGPFTSNGAFEAARGQSFRFLEAGLGRISGAFGTITSDFGRGIVVNLGTGEAIGTGRPVGEALEASLGRTANERRMVRDLRVAGTAGNVEQFYGGRLVADALRADGVSPEAASRVFQRSSPEGYAGLNDFARRAARSHLEAAFRGGERQQVGRFTFFAGGEMSRAGRSRSHDGAGYTITSSGMQFGAETGFERLRLSVFGGMERGTVNTPLLRGNADGWSFGGRLSYLLDPARDLTVSLDGIFASFGQDGRRQTLNGTSRFRTRSDAGMVRLAAGYTAWRSGRWQLRPEVGLGYGSATTRAFTETNAAALEALSVGRQTSSGLVLDAGFGTAFQASERFTVTGGLRVVADFAGSRRRVDAGFAGDAGRFSVNAPGLGTVTGEARMGVEFRPTGALSLRLNGGAGVSDHGVFSGDLSARAALRF